MKPKPLFGEQQSPCGAVYINFKYAVSSYYLLVIKIRGVRKALMAGVNVRIYAPAR